MKQAFPALVVVLTLAGFACIGIAHIVRPDWFIKRSGVRKGGTMLEEWNRLGFQSFGVVVVVIIVYFLYSLLKR